ncbi:stage II sporulation protein D [Paenibacillus castaneae]|uniref:stage II sporulation protein D n=2 Tax=Paenibacillus TaxID=44249 RepID=UPI000C9B3C36|nr:stage II sporulation protein D [Paenibacillus castaneae]NIK79376.1 stage II sporulation protein D [Paenibacillus castaneae]
MRRNRESLIRQLRLLRTSRFWQMFGVGILLGASIVFIKLSLTEIAGSRSSVTNTNESTLGYHVSEGLGANSKVDLKPMTELESPDGSDMNALDRLNVRVYLTKEKRMEIVPLETYVQGVLAGEMPVDFELEALKAQAIAARTYIVRRLALKDRSGMEVENADVTDTIEHQVYVPLAKLASKWTGEDKKNNLAKLKKAVMETKGLIITYKGEPIQAAFFSTSNGFTENSEDYWEQSLPYLRSVASPWDEVISPRYKETIELNRQDFYRKMGLSGKLAEGKPAIKLLEKTAGNRIKTIAINGQSFSGRDVRERLALASSQFTWLIKNDSVAFTTFGFGHGIGMSQWGANGMAKEGSSAEDIIRHYYTGTKVEQASKLPIQSNS